MVPIKRSLSRRSSTSAASGYMAQAFYRSKRVRLRGIATIGSAGFRSDKIEGDRATPRGQFSIQSIWLRPDRASQKHHTARPVLKPSIARSRSLPRLGSPCRELVHNRSHLPIRLIHRSVVWCEDASSPHYNRPQRVSGLDHTTHPERLWRKDHLYDVVLELTHNRSPAIAGLGSAVFIHLYRTPNHATRGCVGLDRSFLYSMISDWARSGSQPLRVRLDWPPYRNLQTIRSAETARVIPTASAYQKVPSQREYRSHPGGWLLKNQTTSPY